MRRSALLVLCFAASCATVQGRGPPSDPDLAACTAGEAAACARLGHRSLAGEGVPRSERAAAAWLMVACERGDAQSCADLGALYAAGRGVRQDDGRACDLGLADACGRVGRPVPATPLAPAIALPPAGSAEEPPVPKDPRLVEDRVAWAELFVPEEARAPLALTREDLEADPPAPQTDVDLVRGLFRLRGPEAARCLPVYVSRDRYRRPAYAMLNFRLTLDGRAAAVRVNVSPKGASDGPAACVAAAVSRWEFPAPRVGGRIFLHMYGTGPEEAVAAAADSKQPAYATQGYTTPQQKEPDCVARNVRIPSDGRGASGATGPFIFKFAVGPDGRVSRFLAMGDAPLPVARAVRDAVQGCEWQPGKDPSGRPTSIWVILPIRFAWGY